MNEVDGVQGSSGHAVLGSPIDSWDPVKLELHRAVRPPRPRDGSALPDAPESTLPAYVFREHDRELAEVVEGAIAGRSGMAVLVGTSATGKTRACWEAVQSLAVHGWRLWHPFDPTRADAAYADIPRVAPKTVVWLNEAQHYLGHDAYGERIASRLHTLLLGPGPVLVLGTLWPEYADRYKTVPGPGAPDPHTRVRALLKAYNVLHVPDVFDEAALGAARELAARGDAQLAHVLDHRHENRITQGLAGAPELLATYKSASPGTRAILDAAVDARRMGMGLHVPGAFLEAAAEGYFTEPEWDALEDHWFEDALAAAVRPVLGGSSPSPLRRVRHRPDRPDRRSGPGLLVSGRPAVYRLEDYLEQHGRQIREDLFPPESFWAAAEAHLGDQADDILALANAAMRHWRLYWANRLFELVPRTDTESFRRPRLPAEREPFAFDEWDGDHRLLEAFALDNYEHDGDMMAALAFLALGAGEFEPVAEVARRHDEIGSRVQAVAVLWAAGAGDFDRARELARSTGSASDDEALTDDDILTLLALLVAGTGDFGRIAELIAETEESEPETMTVLAYLAAGAGDFDRAAEFARALDADAQGLLALLPARAAEFGEAVELAAQDPDAGVEALQYLGVLSVGAGDFDRAAALAARAPSEDGMWALLAFVVAGAGDFAKAARLVGDDEADALIAVLACLLAGAGRLDEAEEFARRSVDGNRDDGFVLAMLELMRAGRGQLEEARAGVGDRVRRGIECLDLLPRMMLPYGLDADGRASECWTAAAAASGELLAEA
ncbi:transcriptional regulator [Yinghuangia soli]|uniref:Transcriptional regulator n=1 Tax=Yinghuangia soli TaxID=2908204 RepID=A0AA41Q925_9ACTN|nr:transcriptional regulator [Yinghuangia soli]MCF2533001.1 transcriptional regulator [Yinghuangia soli]